VALAHGKSANHKNNLKISVTFFIKRHSTMQPIFTEEEIIIGIREGKRLVFEYIHKQYGPKVFGYVLKNSGTQADASDILHLTLTTLWKNIVANTYTHESKLEAYFHRIATFLWLETLRKRKNALEKPHYSDIIPEMVDDSEQSLATAILKNQLIETMNVALERIPTDCRDLF
jgi:DNA-directed RNA polymerase specialized sigma24 family protein